MSTPGNLPVPGVWHKKLLAYLWYDIILLLWLGVVALIAEIKTRVPVINVENIEKKTGNVTVITGGPRGIAVGLLERLLQMDYTVIMGVRNVEDGKRRLQKFYQSNHKLPKNVHFFEMDLMSLKSMRKFADNVLNKVERIDLLLLNAANMHEPYLLTEDGFESQFQVNYLSNFLLTQLLLVRIKETSRVKGSACHIIYTSSVVSEMGRFNFPELGKPIVYTSYKFYFTSKLCQVASMLFLNKKLMKDNAQVYCSACHPGLIPTDLWFSGISHFAGLLGQWFRPLFRTIKNGADTVLLPAFSPDLQNRGGLYMASGAVREPSQEARSEENQSLLYEKSMEFIQHHL